MRLQFLIFTVLLSCLSACSSVLRIPADGTAPSRELSRSEQLYVDRLLRKIEIIGTARYPDLQDQITTSTSILVELEIGSNGRLRHLEILRSSNNPQLDAALLDIIRYADPYPPFEDDMTSDSIIMQKSWSFPARMP